MSTRRYATRDQATVAWLRGAKHAGAVTVLGGGWWHVQGWTRPVQGLDRLAGELARRGLVRRVPAHDTQPGLWAWELAPAAE